MNLNFAKVDLFFAFVNLLSAFIVVAVNYHARTKPIGAIFPALTSCWFMWQAVRSWPLYEKKKGIRK